MSTTEKAEQPEKEVEEVDDGDEEEDEDEEEEVTTTKAKKKTKKQLRKERKTMERQLKNAALEDTTVAATKTETSIAAEAKGDLLNAASVTDAGEPAGEIAEKVADTTEKAQDAKGKGKGKGKGKAKEEKEGKGKEKEEKEKKVGKAKTEYGPKPPKLVQRVDKVRWKISQSFVPHMRTEAMFYATDSLAEQIFIEYNEHTGSMLPALQQLGNVAALPGIVGCSLGMPDLHSGFDEELRYGFAIGNVAAIDMSKPEAVVVPGGVGFDINCGVRLLRTNLKEKDVAPVKEKLNSLLFKEVPLGVSSEGGLLACNKKQLDEVLNRGMEYLLEQGVIWPEDIENTEEGGRIRLADATKVSDRAKARGLNQVGSLGSGNHYMEIQVVDEIFDAEAAATMGLKLGGICVMIHSGSRGLGHQVCSDYLQQMQRDANNLVHPNDRQLTGVKINSPTGQYYLAGMSAAANFAFCNRSMMMAKARECFAEIFKKSARDLDMHMVYDVAHNIAKVEKRI